MKSNDSKGSRRVTVADPTMKNVKLIGTSDSSNDNSNLPTTKEEEPPPRPETSASVRYQRRLNNCPKCKGYSNEKPCLEWAEILRQEFVIYIDGLFHKKMREFTDFIEEVVDVDD